MSELMFRHHVSGELAALKFDLRALEKGAISCRPHADFARYDRIVDWQDRLYRVQIKYAGCRSSHSVGVAAVDLRKLVRPFYRRDEIDALVLYLPAVDKICWLGPDLFDRRQSLSIRFAPSKNKQVTGCLFADEYYW